MIEIGDIVTVKAPNPGEFYLHDYIGKSGLVIKMWKEDQHKIAFVQFNNHLGWWFRESVLEVEELSPGNLSGLFDRREDEL